MKTNSRLSFRTYQRNQRPFFVTLGSHETTLFLLIYYLDKVETEIKEMEKFRILERSNSNYSFPMVITRKKNETVRICMKDRKLNDIMITDAKQIPNAEELFVLLSFSKLDMTKGYFQILKKKKKKNVKKEKRKLFKKKCKLLSIQTCGSFFDTSGIASV